MALISEYTKQSGQHKSKYSPQGRTLHLLIPINAHVRWGPRLVNWVGNGVQREDKNLLQRSQLRQHGEFWHVSVSERQRSWLCGQNLYGAFVRLYWQPMSKTVIEQWRLTARQKRLYLCHQGEFQHNYFDFVSLHHSDHDGAVRIFVGHSEVVKRLLDYLDYITWHNFPPTKRVPGIQEDWCKLMGHFPVQIKIIYLSIYLSIYLPTCIYLSIYISIYISIYPSVCLSSYLSIFQKGRRADKGHRCKAGELHAFETWIFLTCSRRGELTLQ